MSFENTIRILVASDNHVGYNERDPVRGDDSWRSFHEVMSIAQQRDVDMVLLAGDLFHENKPSRKSMYKVSNTLRQFCYGDRPCELELLSDPSLALNDVLGHINYEDPDINVAIPVLAISGNHDDTSGEVNLSALDILAATGLVNHFGKVPENDNITLAPLLFRKGDTQLALYGMANVRDERLHRTFRDHKVKFLRPDKGDGGDKFFNLMALHQNHYAHTETGYLPENFLPDFLDLVVWGHEHECLLDSHTNAETGFQVIQPGSSVATSLCEGEATEKCVGILSITGTNFELEKVRLKTVRPFVMREVVLSRDCGFVANSKMKGEVIQWLMNQVEELILKAQEQWAEANSVRDDTGLLSPPSPPPPAPLPLIRLRVEYSGGYEVENPRRFSNRFVGRVANVNDVVQFYRKKSATNTRRANDVSEEVRMVEAVELSNLKVQSLVEEFLKQHTLDVVPVRGMNEAIDQFVTKDDKQSIKAYIEETIEAQVKRLLNLGVSNEDDIDSALTAHAIEGNATSSQDGTTVPQKRKRNGATAEASNTAKAPQRGSDNSRRQLHPHNDGSEEDVDSADDVLPVRSSTTLRGATSTSARQTTTAAARRITTTAPSRSSRAANNQSLFMGDDDEDDDDTVDALPATQRLQRRNNGGGYRNEEMGDIYKDDEDEEMLDDYDDEYSRPQARQTTRGRNTTSRSRATAANSRARRQPASRITTTAAASFTAQSSLVNNTISSRHAAVSTNTRNRTIAANERMTSFLTGDYRGSNAAESEQLQPTPSIRSSQRPPMEIISDDEDDAFS
ncbi:Mre11 DNA-binding presumed domain-containing protein [Limtongia smithiae]|uniref:Mre11 DNA-binding presumed domain-containing protein n=1 Tax=Limtongia smithiae TaxID=1125753 RepID=UPI0034CE236C